MFSIEGMEMFQPESLLDSSFLGDRFFLPVVGLVFLFYILGKKDENARKAEKEKQKNANAEKKQEEVVKDENPIVQQLRESIHEEYVNRVQPQETTDTTTENGNVIKRVVTTETVVEYVSAAPKQEREISIKCPACGTINKVKEGTSAPCTSCLYTLQAITQ